MLDNSSRDSCDLFVARVVVTHSGHKPHRNRGHHRHTDYQYSQKHENRAHTNQHERNSLIQERRFQCFLQATNDNGRLY
jgi:hypothetical protein